ncbi:MAG: VirB3 family type IV secretion system protein [Deltaproteobacteria bacterium]|jgi:type IV secretory pathway TrbD component|nr:VirB3 family type IV secretion system protein [Deltaproteobacteria bacterium]
MDSALIHRSLHKPNLVLGAEREPILTAALLPLAFTLSSFSLVMLLSGLAFWLIAGFFLRAMARRDPMLFKLWMRSVNYKGFYPARTNIWWRAQNRMK